MTCRRTISVGCAKSDKVAKKPRVKKPFRSLDAQRPTLDAERPTTLSEETKGRLLAVGVLNPTWIRKKWLIDRSR